MMLIHTNHEMCKYSIYENLNDIIHTIYYLTEPKDYSKFFIIYQSSFKSQYGTYYMSFISIDCEDRYIIQSDKFISLKEVNHLVKKTAKMFFKEGGVITNYE